jgi:hypothetical protein
VPEQCTRRQSAEKHRAKPFVHRRKENDRVPEEPVGCRNSFRLSVVLVEQTAEPVTSEHTALIVAHDGWTGRCIR